MKRYRFVVLAALVAVVIVGIVGVVYFLSPRLTEEEVSEVVVSTITREAPASFLVTGTVDATATTTLENTKYLLPESFRFNLGTTRATVRAPGRLSYGFDVRELEPSMIRLSEDGRVTVVIPDLRIHSVEVDLDKMEVQTEVGWARLYSSSGREVERRAIGRVQQVLRRQGRAHLRDSAQPRVNTARALETMLTPVLQSAGIDEPRFRFQLGPELVLETE